MMRRGGRRRRTDPYAILLLVQLGQQIAQLEQKPPVTLATIAACFLAYYNEVLPPQLQPPSVQHACLQPYLIVQNRQWGRLIWSALLHADEVHLIYNMASFLYKGAMLEPRLGSAKFAALLAELLLLSHGLVVVVSGVASSYIPDYKYLWFSSCAVGFSAVIFALKVVLSHDSPGYSNVMGFNLPTKYMAWAELLLASVLNPRASFLGHLCGILAGFIHVKYLAPGASRLQAWLIQQQRAAAAAERQRASRQAAAAAGGGGGGSAGRGAGTSTPSTRHAAVAGNRSPGVGESAAAAAAAAAAHQRIQAQQQRGIPSRREQQQQGHRAVADADEDATSGSTSSSRQPLSAEELRLRRLQRFA